MAIPTHLCFAANELSRCADNLHLLANSPSMPTARGQFVLDTVKAVLDLWDEYHQYIQTVSTEDDLARLDSYLIMPDCHPHQPTDISEEGLPV